MTQWQLKQKAPEEFQKQFPEYFGVVLQLLYDRGFKTAEEISRFFNCDYNTCSHDSFLMKGMEETCQRIFQAIKKQEKVMLVGDYDADGVCGLTILYETLKNLGAKKLDTYISDREKQGYGLNMEIVKTIADEHYDLVTTIDCGISDRQEIEFLDSQKIDIIVIDHHLIPEVLPPATIIVNPKQEDDNYPFKYLCAAGLAYKLSQALYKNIEETSKETVIKAGAEKWFLDLVAIATVADVAPLLDENRVFVKYGLYVLSKTRRVGLKELMKVARIKPTIVDNDLVATNLNTHTIGFQLAPRINVASRMDHANTAFKLLTTQLKDQAQELALGLEQKNKERQKITDKIIKEIESRRTSDWNKLIFEYGENWPVGILGIIAGKLAEKYYVPAFILSKKEKTATGSARSIPPLNITQAIASAKNLVEEYGGHHQAAGLTLKNEHLEEFKDGLIKYIENELKPDDFMPVLKADCELAPRDITWALYDEIEKFAPFGEGNPRPKFLIKNLIVKNISIVGNGNKHLKLALSENKDHSSKIFKAIGFGLGNLTENINLNGTVDIIVELIIDEWNGNRELQFNIVDVK